MLRKCLSAAASKRIVATIDKDYTQLHERDLPERVVEEL